MIPRKLQLKNFLSYGAEFQIIDFAEHHLIYLSGKNGHGKSALLDAMTWAVWGQARKVTTAVRADQGLIRLGQTQMAVIFDFEVNGQLYRTKREFLKTHNKPLVQLEFGVFNDQTNEFIPLTDKTIRTTQAKIEETIKLDYDSFINTAFLRQGNANEFSRKSPKERKEILGTILGLQQFDLLKKRALDKIKHLQAQRTAITTLQESYATQLAQKEFVEKEWDLVQKEKDSFVERQKKIVAQKKAIDAQQAAFLEQQKKYEIALFKLKEQRQQYDLQLHKMRGDVSKWRTVQAQQRDMPNMQDLEKRYAACKKEAASCDEQFKKLMHLEKEKLTATQALQTHMQNIEKKQLVLKQELLLKKERVGVELEGLKKEAIETNAESAKKEEQLKKLTQEQKELSSTLLSQEKVTKMHAQFEKRKEMYHQWVAQRNVLQTEQQALLQRQTMVQDENPSCPLCEQNLSAARKKFLKNKYAKEECLSQHQFKRLATLLPKLKELLINQHTYLDEQKKLHEKSVQSKKEAEQLSEELKKATALKNDRAKKITDREKLLAKLEKEEQEIQRDAVKAQEKDTDCSKMKERVQDLEQAIKAVRYDEKIHKAVQSELTKIEKERVTLFALQQDMLKQIERREAIGHHIQDLKRMKKEMLQQEKQLMPDAVMKKLQSECEETRRAFEDVVKSYGDDREALREKIGVISQKREQLEKILKEDKKQASELKKLDAELHEYQDIAAAAGKDGIQALLIEDAIPEVEQAANELLSRLTHNQAQILIESLRDLKRGGTKETLDITISDPSGIRPYEMFSGGEAFRIDFALRIAISKLLARRAGTSLQTLIIDEGFGSQDEEGLSLIMDAMYKIQDDFEKVIVVSHLPSMKDQFPVHFNVEKGPGGSRVQVIEQG